MNQKGMTLVETVVGGVLLALLVAGMFTLYDGAGRLMSKVNRVYYAHLLVQEKLEELLGVGFEGYSSYSWTPGYDPNAANATYTMTESADAIKSALGADANDFIRRYLVERVAQLKNMDDWTPGGTIDYRMVEVKVKWSE